MVFSGAGMAVGFLTKCSFLRTAWQDLKVSWASLKGSRVVIRKKVRSPFVSY